IYGYDHFVCDSSGSLCEVVDPEDPADPLLREMSAAMLLVWIRGTEAHVEELARRFDRAPKPMYYDEAFLRRLWDEYCTTAGVEPDAVDPDAFIRYGFRRLLAHRLPRYEAIARRWGVTVEADEVAALEGPEDFVALIAEAIARAK